VAAIDIACHSVDAGGYTSVRGVGSLPIVAAEKEIPMVRQTPGSRRGPDKVRRIDQARVYRIFVHLPAGKTWRELSEFSVDHCCMPHHRDEKTGAQRLMAYAKGADVKAMRAAGHRIEVLADADREGKRLQKLISKKDRFRGGRSGPDGIGNLL
jgi:hypothetical protein